jgi:hypothetical protein
MTPPTDERIKELSHRVERIWQGDVMSFDEKDDILSILSSYSSLRAENERLSRSDKFHRDCLDVAITRRKEAEAALANANQQIENLNNDINAGRERFLNIQAQLAKQAPLIQAVMDAEGHGRASFRSAILRAALAYREGEK